MLFASVREFLDSQVRGRPQTFEELVLHVDKSRASVWREVNSLLLYGEVNIIVLRFNGRDCPLYTLRREVRVSVVRGPVIVEVLDESTVIALDRVEKT